MAARRRDRRERRRRSSRCRALRRLRASTSAAAFSSCGAVRIARPLRPPGIIDRAGNFQRLFDLGVIVPHLAPIERPVRAIAELAARLEPFRPKAQRHHGEMHGRAADRFAAIVGAELQADCRRRRSARRSSRACAAAVRRRRNPPAAANTGRHRTPRRRSQYSASLQASVPPPAPVPTMAKSTASSSGYSRIGTQPPARNTSGARPPMARGRLACVSRHVRSPAVPRPRARASLPRLPRDRAGRNPSAHSRAGSPGRRSRSRSRPSDARNRR